MSFICPLSVFYLKKNQRDEKASEMMDDLKRDVKKQPGGVLNDLSLSLLLLTDAAARAEASNVQRESDSCRS